MEVVFPKENMKFVLGSFIEQHNLAPFKITTNFTQIELNITIVDNAHAIKSITSGSKNILKLDDLEVMAMARNKQRKCMRLLQEVLSIIAQEDPYIICLLSWHKYIDIVKSTITRWLEGVTLPFHYFFPFHCVCWNVVAWSYCFIVGKIQVHNILENPNSPTIHLKFGNLNDQESMGAWFLSCLIHVFVILFV